MDDINALTSQNKQHLNEILKLATAGRGREVISTGRSGRLIQRRVDAFDEEETRPTTDLKQTDLNDNASDETLSQVRAS